MTSLPDNQTGAKMTFTHLIPPIPTLNEDQLNVYRSGLGLGDDAAELSEDGSALDEIEIDQSQKEDVHSAVYLSSFLLDDNFRVVISKYRKTLRHIKILLDQEDSQDRRSTWALFTNGFVHIHVWADQCADNEETFIECLRHIPRRWQERIWKHLSDIEHDLDEIEKLMAGATDESILLELPRTKVEGYCKSVSNTIEKLTANKRSLRLAISVARSTIASHQNSMNKLPRAPVVLCLDGGGAKSYSSLLILKALMDTISNLWDETSQADPESELPPQKPCDVFDFIFGSSSGGLVAIMLGRLEMSVDEATERFLTYTTKVFSESRKRRAICRLLLSSKYNERTIVNATRRLVDKYDPMPQPEKWRRNKFLAPEVKCKTGVIACSLKSVDIKPHVFRSYEITTKSERVVKPTPKRNDTSSAEIWEVARATSAAPLLFPPQTIDGIEYVDGGLGANNPTLEAIRELETLGADLKTTCIVSIGSGLSSVKPRKHSFPLGQYLDAFDYLRVSATDTEKTSSQASAMAAVIDGCDYFRFNAPYDQHIDLDELHGEKYITSAVCHYLESPDTLAALKLCANLIVTKIKGKNELPLEHKFFMVPYTRSSRFTGRQQELVHLEQCLLNNNQKAQAGPNIFVVTSLVGQGKTELCMEFAYRMRQRYWGIFWVDATSLQAAEADFMKVMSLLGYSFEGLENAVKTLSNIQDRWLLILDAADGILPYCEKFISSASRGSIIINSRSLDCEKFSTVGNQRLAPLSTSQLTDLFWSYSNSSSSPRQATDKELAEIQQLLDLAGHHTYATVVIANIVSDIYFTVADIIHRLQNQRSSILRYRFAHLHSHYASISDMVEITMARIREQKGGRQALDLFNILSVLHSSQIPMKMFDEADQGFQDFVKLEDNRSYPLKSKMTSVGAHAPPFFTNDKPNGNHFGQALGLLTVQSLVAVSGSDISIHPVFRTWALECQDRDTRNKSWLMTGWIFASSYLRPTFWKTHQQQMRPHLQTWLQAADFEGFSFIADTQTLEIMLRCGKILSYMKMDKELKQLIIVIARIFGLSQQVLDIHNPLFYDLCVIDMLNQGQHLETKRIAKEIVSMKRRFLGDGHPEVIAAMNVLTKIYLACQENATAMQQAQQTFDEAKLSLSEDQPEMILAYGLLAMTYARQGEYERAEQYGQQAVNFGEKYLGDQHPDTLQSMQGLGVIYTLNHRYDEAESLTPRVLAKRKAVLGEDHPDTLESVHELASLHQASSLQDK